MSTTSSRFRESSLSLSVASERDTPSQLVNRKVYATLKSVKGLHNASSVVAHEEEVRGLRNRLPARRHDPVDRCINPFTLQKPLELRRRAKGEVIKGQIAVQDLVIIIFTQRINTDDTPLGLRLRYWFHLQRNQADRQYLWQQKSQPPRGMQGRGSGMAGQHAACRR